MERDARDALAEAAIEWAAGGRGQPLVDAAAQALTVGVDSPTLRILAGAPRAMADDEAIELAPTVFEELGLEVPERFLTEALLARARQQARRFLTDGGSARQLARYLLSIYVEARYPEELADWVALEDNYDLLEQGIMPVVLKISMTLSPRRPEPSPMARRLDVLERARSLSPRCLT